MHNKNVLIVA